MLNNVSYVNSNQACDLCASYVPNKRNMRYSLTKCDYLRGRNRRGCIDACQLCNNRFKLDQPNEGFVHIPFQLRYNHVNSIPIYNNRNNNNGYYVNSYMPYSNNGNYFVSTYRNSGYNLPKLVPMNSFYSSGLY